MWFWYDLLEILCEEYWICPYCGSLNVAETYSMTCGKYRDGDPYGPFDSVDDEPSIWWCEDCDESWESWVSPFEIEKKWKDWKGKGFMIKEKDL